VLLHTFDHEVIDGYAGVFEIIVNKSDRILFTPQMRLSKLLRLLVLRFIQKDKDVSVDPLTRFGGTPDGTKIVMAFKADPLLRRAGPGLLHFPGRRGPCALLTKS
jgi:hypothetical protein